VLLIGTAPARGEIRLQSPLQQWRVTSSYGERVHPTTGARHFHNGLDLAASEGTPVYPIADGVVHSVGEGEYEGKFIVLTHEDEYESHYYHLSEINVAVGDSVALGTAIGKSGRTGRVTAAHLHFGLKKTGEWVNPASHLKTNMSGRWQLSLRTIKSKAKPEFQLNGDGLCDVKGDTKNSLIHMIMVDPETKQPLFEASPKPVAFIVKEETPEKIVIVLTEVGKESEGFEVVVTRDGSVRATITGTDSDGPYELRLTGSKIGNREY
jgi:hypothetical protein